MKGEFLDLTFLAVYSSDGSHLLAAFGDGSVCTWDTTSGGTPQVLETGCKDPLLFSLDGSLLIIHSEDQRGLGYEQKANVSGFLARLLVGPLLP